MYRKINAWSTIVKPRFKNDDKKIRYTVKINNSFNEIILISSNIDRVPVRHNLKKVIWSDLDALNSQNSLWFYKTTTCAVIVDVIQGHTDASSLIHAWSGVKIGLHFL